ncbi:T9SS type A sorting domain-containing protein [Flavobacterium sp.]|uniref:T9SS type A sorting domain-containing protein n=1 Tax=Flavobacterium sp. TaxID=239 RepID=UPI00120FC1D0|nr:T9SS type A sorting domain-containing protein [Flavobacterium sp.]RZJ72135.1 MAG: T9SS type A sorting domain-containing protein [Flavobacterium sp.]
MKTTFTLRKFFLPAFIAISSIGYSQYCTPDPLNCSVDDEIQNVTFAGINNNSGCGNDDGYSDFTATAAGNVVTGQTYTLTVTVGEGQGEVVAAYIDFNANNSFEESELIYVGATPGGTVSTTVLIPESAVTGATRMRVRNAFNGFEDPEETLYTDWGDGACIDVSIGFGETEDYTLNITAGTQCSGTPDIGAATASVTSVCGGTDFTVSAVVSGTAIGFSYQLQASTDGGTTWTNTGTANSTGTFTVSQSVATSYQVIATCVASNQTDTSASVAVAQNGIADCYCTPTATNPLNCEDGDIMTNVTFGALNNTTTCGENGYTNYSAAFDAVELTAGQTYPISVAVGPSGDGWLDESVGVWIDYNQDGSFDADEFTYVGTGLAETLTGNIVIPETALDGNTRMRVLVSATTAAAFNTTYACSPLTPTNNYGEIEDYVVNITNDLATGQFNNGLVGMYPNPAQDVVNFTVKNGVSLQSAEIYNITGQVVGKASFTSAAEGKMNISALSAGVYIVKLTTDQGSVSQRLVKK